MIVVWDIWVRLFHWSLAFAVTFSLLSGKTGFLFYDWHKSIGEIVLALVVFRIIWGFFGSSTARLTPLFSHPRLVFQHLKSVLGRRCEQTQYGHNPAGGYAVLALLLLCGIQALTGQFIADHDDLLQGRFYNVVGHDTSHLIHDIHHTVGGLLQWLVIVHVVVVFVYLFYAKTNLLKPMVTGLKEAVSDQSLTQPELKPWWMGLLLAVVTTVLYFLLFFF